MIVTVSLYVPMPSVLGNLKKRVITALPRLARPDEVEAMPFEVKLPSMKAMTVCGDELLIWTVMAAVGAGSDRAAVISIVRGLTIKLVTGVGGGGGGGGGAEAAPPPPPPQAQRASAVATIFAARN